MRQHYNSFRRCTASPLHLTFTWIFGILDRHPHMQAKVIWARAHQRSNPFNEAADSLAKQACHRPIHRAKGARAALSWKREQAYAKAQSDWQDSWTHRLPQARGAYITTLPKVKVPQAMKEVFEAPRSESARAIQVMLGHGFFGEFYARHVPSERTDCPCGEEMQTREHILLRCPIHGQARREAKMHGKTERWLLNTEEGRRMLLKFLAKSNAFKKVTRRAPEEEERIRRARGWHYGNDVEMGDQEDMEDYDGEGASLQHSSRESSVISGWSVTEQGDEDKEVELPDRPRPVEESVSWPHSDED